MSKEIAKLAREKDTKKNLIQKIQPKSLEKRVTELEKKIEELEESISVHSHATEKV